ncbi:hypothetical protein GCM10007276_21350 [Agaricicola taiwanensis]|uniref:Uncharacterized protein n=1 Tax=Agaricicola taiwanensis TaxID=591372 RepID=A0A8J2YHT8_9RHOB|nr:hypothetical protein [Agaricicola taiwanensis]GGE43955.1 hypothetical protein GCM10007276_21350 [Agaricicola taiwanensis]
MRLDATKGAHDPEARADVPAADAAAEPETEALVPDGKAAPDEPAPEPVAVGPEPKVAEPGASDAAPEVKTVETASLASKEAPPIEVARPLAGDRPRPTKRPKRRSRALLLLVAAAAGAGIVWSGILTPFLASGGRSGEGYNPPPKLADASTAETPTNVTEPRQVTRPEGEAAVADELRALKDNVARAETETDERVVALTKRIDALEKQHADTVAELKKRLASAEEQLASVGAAATPSNTATAAARPQPLPDGEEGREPAAEAPPADPVIASTEQTASNPLPQPRPSDLGSISVVRPPASQQTASVPSSPVLRSWVLRDVYGGVALIEGRYGMIEVVEGSVLPGGGVVQDIRRAGGRWVVTTNRGIIASGR